MHLNAFTYYLALLASMNCVLKQEQKVCFDVRVLISSVDSAKSVSVALGLFLFLKIPLNMIPKHI